MTKQRTVILDVITSDMCHHTAEEIFELAKEKLPGISLATVYNTLKYLEEKKLIRRISAEGSGDRYDNSYIPHGHLFCSECLEVIDFTLPEFDKTLCEHLGEDIDSYELKVKYVCPACRRAAVGEQSDMPKIV